MALSGCVGSRKPTAFPVGFGSKCNLEISDQFLLLNNNGVDSYDFSYSPTREAVHVVRNRNTGGINFVPHGLRVMSTRVYKEFLVVHFVMPAVLKKSVAVVPEMHFFEIPGRKYAVWVNSQNRSSAVINSLIVRCEK